MLGVGERHVGVAGRGLGGVADARERQVRAGEASSRPVPAAIANAVFDATGVRIRRAPFSPDYVKSALS